MSTKFEFRVYQIIQGLPAKCKAIFEMNRFEGKSNDEIAIEMNISKRTVETHISNAIKTLREKLSKEEWIILRMLLML